MAESMPLRNLIEWKIPLDALAPAVAAGLAFAAIRTAYFQYYGEFGLTPESVGIGAGRILSDLLIGPVTVGLFLGALCVLSYAVALKLGPKDRPARPPKAIPMLRMAAIAMSLSMLASAAYLVILSREAAANATAHAVPFSVVRVDFGILRLPLLQVYARHVHTLSSSDANDQTLADIKSNPCVLVIGEAEGRTYFYQTKTQLLYTVATGSISYSVDTTSGSMSPDCKPPGGPTRRSH